MRLDELPTSDRIEDRRRFPGGRAGLGIGPVGPGRTPRPWASTRAS